MAKRRSASKAEPAWWDDDPSDTRPEPLICFLCTRPLGSGVEWHHPVPKSRGGKLTVAVHPICHKTIHATLSNAELARSFATAEALRAQPDLARFIAWVAGKDPDFHAPTRKPR